MCLSLIWPSVECYSSFSKASLSIDIKVYSCTCASDLLIFFLFKNGKGRGAVFQNQQFYLKQNTKSQKSPKNSITKLMLPIQELLKMYFLAIRHSYLWKTRHPCFHFPLHWVTPGLANTISCLVYLQHSCWDNFLDPLVWWHQQDLWTLLLTLSWRTVEGGASIILIHLATISWKRGKSLSCEVLSGDERNLKTEQVTPWGCPLNVGWQSLA